MNTKIQMLTRTALLLALVISVQMMGFPQLVTGPIVNFILFISVYFVGIAGGVGIGALTPWIALSRGILPPPLAPMVPFIILGNVSQVIIFGLLRRINKYAAIPVAAIAKFLILASGVRFFVKVPGPVAEAMQFPQLVTAVIGGVLALAVVESLIRNKALSGMKHKN